MLEFLKVTYEKVPIPISSLIVKGLKLNPYYSKKTWDYLDYIQENYKNLELLQENLINLEKSVKKNLFYEKQKKTDNFNFMDSDDLREKFEDIIDKNVQGYFTSTGGSGRKPSKLYLSNDSYKMDVNHVIWSWKEIGYRKGDKKLTLRGTNLGDKLYKFNPIYNELQINTFLMSEGNIDEILKAIEKFNPNFGHGYPSAFVRIAKLSKDKKLNFKLKGISLASEGFNESQREIIEEKFQCPARGFFGHSERACFASETLKRKGVYKVLLTYGLIEIIKDNGESATEDEEGEIVCTGFINKAMPLIKYRTGDYATVNESVNGVVIEIRDIKGRWGKDFVYDLEKNPISTTSINVHSKDQYDFKYIQLFQSIPGKLIIKLVPWKINSKLEEVQKRIILDFQEKLKNVIVEGKIVDEGDIYKSHRGKIPYLVSEIK